MPFRARRSPLPLTPLSFEILLALIDEDRHGYAILQVVESRLRAVLPLRTGTIYRALARLMEEGLIAEMTTMTSGDERRRTYRITAEGRKIARAEAERLADQVAAARAHRLLPGAAEVIVRTPIDPPGQHRVARWCHRLALGMYPQAFRQQFGDDLERIFVMRLTRAATRTRWRAAVLAAYLVGDAFSSGLVERMHVRWTHWAWPNSARADATHRSWSMTFETLMADLRLALRQLRRAPMFAALTIASLALGIGANSAIFSVVHGVLLRPLPYAAPSDLVMIWSDNTRQSEPRNPVSPANFEAFKAAPSLSGVEALYSFLTPGQLRAGGDPDLVQCATITPGMFGLLGRRALVGETFGPGETVPRIVLSFQYWQRRFGGDPQVVGRPVSFVGGPHATIAGVMPEDFSFPYRSMLGPSGFTRALQPDIWIPLVPQADARYNDPAGQPARTLHYLGVIGRLNAGATTGRARADLTAIAKERAGRFPDTNQGWGVTVTSLHEQTVGAVQPALFVLLGGVGIVLLITCINVANVLLARATGRQHDLAIRSALGASRRRLIQQMLVESLVLAGAGGAVGLAVTLGGIRALVSLAPADLPRLAEVGPSLAVVMFALVLSIVTGVAVGILPALMAARSPAQEALRESRRTTASPVRRRIRAGLIVAEVSMATALAVGAGLLLRSFVAVLGIDPGFQMDRLLTLQMNVPQGAQAPAARLPFYDQLEARLRAIPGVTHVGGTTRLPLGSTSVTTQVDVEGRDTPPAQRPEVELRRAVFDYFGAMGIPILRGRAFTPDDGTNAPIAGIVNTALVARVFGHEDPIGRRIRIGPPNPNAPFITIVGVVASIKHGSLEETPRPELYLYYRQNAPVQPFLAIRAAGDADALAPAVRQAIREAGADPPFELRTMTQIRSSSVAERRFVLMLVALFGAIALALAAVGVYGIITLVAAERTTEVGIRMALGATPAEVLALMIGQALKLAIVGVALGVGLGLILSPAIRSQLFSVGSADPLTYVVVAATLLFVAVTAAYVPARRAMKVDPATTLK